MSMRAAYCNPGEKIQWYTVSWPADSLSWEDFRGEVLGATDPSGEYVIVHIVLFQHTLRGLQCVLFYLLLVSYALLCTDLF